MEPQRRHSMTVIEWVVILMIIAIVVALTVSVLGDGGDGSDDQPEREVPAEAAFEDDVLDPERRTIYSDAVVYDPCDPASIDFDPAAAYVQGHC